jgi:hypothetical protein
MKIELWLPWAQALIFISLVSPACHSRTSSENSLSGLFISHVAIQKSGEYAIRGFRALPFEPVISDEGRRFQNALMLNYQMDENWRAHFQYVDLRSFGEAYSLTNPLSYGVNTYETEDATDFIGTTKNVDYLSGIYELNSSYELENWLFIAGKIDTSLYYLGNPVFAGDLLNGADYGNAATRIVAPPFPSISAVGKYKFDNSPWSITGIIGDAFGDRETLSAGKNIEDGNMSYVLEASYQTAESHFAITLNHIDSFERLDKDLRLSMPSVDAIFITGSRWIRKDFAVFFRAGLAEGDAQQEDFNLVLGGRWETNNWYFIGSQSASRVGSGVASLKGNITNISEITINYRITPSTTIGLTVDYYFTHDERLLDKDGGISGSDENWVAGLRITHFLGF